MKRKIYDQLLKWSLEPLTEQSSHGELEFSVPTCEDDVFFPVTISFNADVEGQSFTLFNIMINSEEGDSVGTITSDDGTVRNVFADITELPDISGLGEDEQNQLYAMQEGLNVLIENLD